MYFGKMDILLVANLVAGFNFGVKFYSCGNDYNLAKWNFSSLREPITWEDFVVRLSYSE